MNRYILDLLVIRIRNGMINPKTNQPFDLEDILIQEYKDAVQQALTIA